ncbi:hypothetical protein BpHYR1_027990 [Brachionus plicatilis]|uniref:Uncharacterized protein n=1 Tax=Brachionus plicatilis TaxID=10195 RepID=A0A3M7SAL1_BRAPC|nr:hypothetical protein BpHYR1_027990 [Brachionus plicatilis]
MKVKKISSFISRTEPSPSSPGITSKPKTIKSLLKDDSPSEANLTKKSITKILSPSSALMPRSSSDTGFDLGKSVEITTKILEARIESDKAKDLEKKSESQPKVKQECTFSKLAKIVKRKNYYQVCQRQKVRLQHTIKEIFAESNHFLRSIGLCISTVELNPIELDECDFQLKIRAPTNEAADKLEPNVNNLLYYKDKHSISDVAYDDLKKMCHLDIPSIFKLKQRRGEINSMFEIFENEMGVYVSLKEKIIIRLQNYYDCNQGEFGGEEKTLHIKLGADGTNIGRNLKLLNFTFTIINEGAKAKTANGNYTIGIFEIESENYEALIKCFKEITAELRQIEHLTLNNKRVNLVFYFAADWKMLAQSLGLQSANSKYPCVWCKCCKDDFHDMTKEWSITDVDKGCRTYQEHQKVLRQDPKEPKYGYYREPIFKDIIPISRYIIDMLHLYLRISDNLLNLLIKECCEADKFDMGAISKFDLSQYHHLNTLQTTLRSKCNIRLMFQWVPETRKLNWRDLVGPEKNRLFENLRLVEVIPEYANLELLQKIWDDFYSIIKLVRNNELNADQLKQNTRDWLADLLKIYPRTTVTPYMHAFVAHLHEFVFLYQDINAFNCQGLEKLNDISTNQYFKGTNKRSSALRQMMDKRNRMEYLGYLAIN